MMWRPVVAPRKPPQVPCSSQAGSQPGASEPGTSTPQPTKGKGKGKAANAKPAPQPGRWLDRDCNAALNMQRIGQSRCSGLRQQQQRQQQQQQQVKKGEGGDDYFSSFTQSGMEQGAGMELLQVEEQQYSAAQQLLRSFARKGFVRRTLDCPAEAFEAEHAAYSHWDSVFKVGKLANRGFVFDRRILTDGVSVCVQYTRPLDYTPPGPSGSSPAASPAADPSGSSPAADPLGPSGSSPAAGPAADLSGSSPAANPPGPSGSSPAAGPVADPSGSSPAAGPVAADPSGSSPAAEDPSDGSSSNTRTPADIGSGLADERAFLFDPDTQMGMGLDPGAIQAVSAASGVWHADGRLQGFYRSKLTRSQVQHDSGLIQARHNTQRWNENVKLELQHLAAATPAGTSLVAIQRHVAVTLATWDAVWGEYLHPKWAEQRMRLHGAQEMVLERYFKKLEEEAASVSLQEWGTCKQLVVFFGNAGIGTRGGWGAKALLQACRKVVERPNTGKPIDRVPGRVVTVDEFRTSRVSSILNSPQPCEEELDSSKPTRPEDWKPKPGQVQDCLLRSAWSKRFAAPVRGLMWCPWLAQATPGELGKWVDRDCNTALNLQRAGESEWRPLELCRWPDRGRLPAQARSTQH
ncbi:hypothetical protein QJQ45_011473 [Haematococcus lacustris]|nr:hypothetical protein QJQ45_011473 [Haematococcus lacustris]